MENYALNIESVERKLQKEKKKELFEQMNNIVKKVSEEKEKKETVKNEVIIEASKDITPSQDYTKIDTHCDYLNKAEDIVDNVSKLFNSLEFDFDYIESQIAACQDEQNDLLHEIELSKDFSQERIIFLYNELHNCRMKRRNYKDLRERIIPLNNFYKKNKSVLQSILAIKKEMEKIRRNKRKPVYVPRIRTDLTI